MNNKQANNSTKTRMGANHESELRYSASTPDPSRLSHDYISHTPYSMQYGAPSLENQDNQPLQSNFDMLSQNSEEEPQYQEVKPKSTLRNVLSIVVTIVVILICARLLNMFVMQSYTIPSGSMEDTIMIKDLVFAEKISTFFSSPEPGEIITFVDPEEYGDGSADQRILIKRVIATGGQTIDLRDGYVYIDGIRQDEPYTDGKPTYPLKGSDITYPYTVPDGEVWVMGDNRTNSQDSRYFGSIPVDSVRGHALFIYWPLSDIAWL